jgi:hypothetical protein
MIRRQAMQTTRLPRLSGLALAVLVSLLFGQGLVFGHDDGYRLEGTWNVTVTFVECHAQCPCPPRTDPDLPPTAIGLHMYLKNGSFLDTVWTLTRGPGLGSWEVIGPHEFEARYKFFLFNPNGTQRAIEVVTSNIHLTVPDEFHADAAIHLFDTAGNRTSPDNGCDIDYDGTRFE